METKEKQFLALFKEIKTLTIESLPEIVSLVPTYGPLLGKIVSKVLSNRSKCGKEMSGDDLQDKIESLIQAVEENEISLSTLKAEMQTELIADMKERSQRLPVYMFGIILYPSEGTTLDQEDMDEIEAVFSQDCVWADEDLQSSADEVYDFIAQYNGDCFRKDGEYFMTPDCLIINLSITDFEYVVRNDDLILDFIQNLNNLLENIVFMEYTVF